MVAAGIFKQAEQYRIRNGRGNFWSDGTAMEIVWILMQFDEEEQPIYIDTDSIKIMEDENDEENERRDQFSHGQL